MFWTVQVIEHHNCGSYFNNLLVVPLLRCHHFQSHSFLFHPFGPFLFCSGVFRLKMHKIPHTWNTILSWSGSVFFFWWLLISQCELHQWIFSPFPAISTQIVETKNIFGTPGGCLSLKLVFLLKIKSWKKLITKINIVADSFCMARPSVMQLKEQKNVFVRTQCQSLKTVNVHTSY